LISAIKIRHWLAPLLIWAALPAFAANKTGVLTPTANLSFGRFVAASGGTIILSPAAARSKTGGVVLLPGGTVSAASFSLTETGTGKSLQWTTITLPSTVTLSSGGSTMTLGNFTSNPATTFAGLTQTVLTVGATLTVGANQAPGAYSGTIQVTVNYQ
jgi:spore coat protein U-like protein